MATPPPASLADFLTRAIAPILRRHGYFRSLQGKLAVDEGGRPLPMYTYPAIEYLGALDLSDAAVLEFGSGQSTLWWAGRSARVVAVEHDDHWVRRLEQAGRANVATVFARREDITTGERYLATVPAGPYDVVALDGLHYYDCAAAMGRLLSPGGMVVFDNADFYPRTTALLRDQGLVQVDFAGFKPTHTDCQVTSLFLAPAFRARPHRGAALPPVPVGGRRHVSVFDQPRTIRFGPANEAIIE